MVGTLQANSQARMHKARVRMGGICCAVLIGASALLAGCTGGSVEINKVVIAFGHSWDTAIQTSFGPGGTVGGPFTLSETVRIYGAVGPGTTSKDKSGYSIAIYTEYLQITNDSVDPSDPNDSWDKVWVSFKDSGIQADGSREALVTLRCRVIDRLGPSPSAFFTLPCELRLDKGTAEKPHRVELTMSMPNPKDNYVIKAKAREPQGIVFFTY